MKGHEAVNNCTRRNSSQDFISSGMTVRAIEQVRTGQSRAISDQVLLQSSDFGQNSLPMDTLEIASPRLAQL